MNTIIKAYESMTAKQRVQKTFQFEKTDRVTIGYESNPAIHAKTKKALGVDYRGVAAPYVEAPLFSKHAKRKIDPTWGL